MSGFGEKSDARADLDAVVVRGGAMGERSVVHGRYDVVCVGPHGEEKWHDQAENVVTTVGKNLALDAYLAGAAYTVTGPFLGLISAASFTATAAADTMTSHAGWLEAGGANAPTYTAPRRTAAWAAASGGSKALSAAAAFVATGAGTVQGVFLALGTGALGTIDSTGGVLYSAGVFSAGTKTVASGDTLNVSYTASL